MNLIQIENFFFLPERNAKDLALIRIITGLLLLYYTFYFNLPGVLNYPESFIHIESGGIAKFLQLLPLKFHKVFRSPWFLYVLQYMTIFFLLLFTLGIKTRLVGSISGLLFFISTGMVIQYVGGLPHLSLCAGYMLVVLLFTPCGDAWSINSKKNNKISDIENLKYSWSVFSCMAMISFIYMSTGLAKIVNGGFGWWKFAHAKAALFLPVNTYPGEFRWELISMLESLPNNLFSLIGFFVQYIELLFPLVLFFYSARIALPLILLGLHLTMYFTKNFIFLDFIAYTIIFYNFRGFIKSIFLRHINYKYKFSFINDISPIVKKNIQLKYYKSYLFLIFTLFVIQSFAIINKVRFYPLTHWFMYSDHSPYANKSKYYLKYFTEDGKSTINPLYSGSRSYISVRTSDRMVRQYLRYFRNNKSKDEKFKSFEISIKKMIQNVGNKELNGKKIQFVEFWRLRKRIHHPPEIDGIDRSELVLKMNI